MDNIELSKKYKNSILKKDENNIDKIKEIFGYDDNTNLIPQCFWGNIINPEIIILAKNPSHVLTDDIDNKYFRNTLIENLKIKDRKNIHNNLLFCNSSFDKDIPFELSGVSKWWRDFFGENINLENKNDFMKKVCVINLCGYYKTSLDEPIPEELFWFYNPNKENHIDDYIEKLLNIDNVRIISVWALNDSNPWTKILNDLRKTAELAKVKNPYQRYIGLIK